MNPTHQKKIEILSQIAEIKRVYSAVENFFSVEGSNCLVVVSASPGEGKTLTTAGLSCYSASLAERKVLAIDMNWYQPRLNEWFDLQQTFHLQDILQGKSWLDFVQPSGFEGLDIFMAPMQEHSAQQGLQSANALGLDILQQAKQRYDLIYVDTASILQINRNMIDPVIFSKLADGMIMVVKSWDTPKQKVKKARMVLESSGVQKIGVLVNHWKNPMH